MGTEKKTTKEINALQDILYNLIADKKFEGISQNKIAKEIGISASQLTKYIDGMEIGLNSLVKIADYFNCSLDYLIGRAKDKTTNENIQKTIKTTGLSEDTINNIIEYKKEETSKPKSNYDVNFKKNCLSALDKLLSHKDFWLVLANAGDYFNTFDELAEIFADMEQSKVTISRQFEIKNTVQPLALFQMQNALIKVVEKIGDTKNKQIHNDFENAKQALYNELTKDGDKE